MCVRNSIYILPMYFPYQVLKGNVIVKFLCFFLLRRIWYINVRHTSHREVVKVDGGRPKNRNPRGILQHFGKYASLLRVKGEDWYHSHVCTVKQRNTKTGNSEHSQPGSVQRWGICLPAPQRSLKHIVIYQLPGNQCRPQEVTAPSQDIRQLSMPRHITPHKTTL